MSSVVLDASALLAYIQGEAGGDKVEAMLEEGAFDVLLSAVNLAEVVAKLTLDGILENQVRDDIMSLGLEIVPFDAGQAFHAGNLAMQTKSLGLSLGDRASLALAAHGNATAWTADRAWKKLKVGVDINLIR